MHLRRQVGCKNKISYLQFSLPQRLTNEQLALALVNTFQQFGPILSVKASRDVRGRPFGFVDFCNPKSAQEAINAASFITVHFRSVRIEPAKCQRKLMVKMAVASSEDLSISMKRMRNILLEHVPEGRLKMNTYQKMGEPNQTIITAVLKFDATNSSDVAYSKLTGIEGWIVNWVNSESSGYGSAVRSSGLVHLIPSKLPPPIQFTVPIYYPTVYPLQTVYPELDVLSRRLPQDSNFEEHVYQMDIIEAEFEELSIKSDGNEKTAAERILECTVFIGRLNSGKVTHDLISEHLKQYGRIRYICLLNKGAVSPVGSKQ